MAQPTPLASPRPVIQTPSQPSYSYAYVPYNGPSYAQVASPKPTPTYSPYPKYSMLPNSPYPFAVAVQH